MFIEIRDGLIVNLNNYDLFIMSEWGDHDSFGLMFRPVFDSGNENMDIICEFDNEDKRNRIYNEILKCLELNTRLYRMSKFKFKIISPQLYK